MRYTGPKHKLCRREGEALCESPKCPIKRRKYPPGQHGQKRSSPRLSDYGLQLRMKQKTKRIYGMTERQFSRFFDLAATAKGDAGDNLLRKLEMRLDNIIYRSGLATTRYQARQLVSHGHFYVNGLNVNIPSYIVKTDDVIALKESKIKKLYYTEATIRAAKEHADWLLWNNESKSIKVVGEPNVNALKISIDTRLIVEYYSH